jgi:hypothetical protein
LALLSRAGPALVAATGATTITTAAMHRQLLRGRCPFRGEWEHIPCFFGERIRCAARVKGLNKANSRGLQLELEMDTYNKAHSKWPATGEVLDNNKDNLVSSGLLWRFASRFGHRRQGNARPGGKKKSYTACTTHYRGGTPRRRGATRKTSSTAQPRQGRELTATSMRTTALLSTAWAARRIRAGRAAQPGWRRRMCCARPCWV